MERRGFLVGVLATVSVALAAGWSSGGGAAPASGGVFGLGGAGAGARVLGGILWVLALGVLVAGGAWLVVDRLRTARGRGQSFRTRMVVLAVAVVVFVLGVVLVAVRVFEDGSGPARQDGVGGPLLQGSPDAGSATGEPGAGVVLGVLAVVALVVLLIFAARLRSRRRDVGDANATSVDEVAEPRGRAPDQSGDLGAAAGRATAHLTGTTPPPANDVVRAWRELASVLPVGRPATATPREFEAAAIDAGVDPAAVDELTTLFEAVRYGDRDPTGERARRAVDALERIETDAQSAELEGPSAADTEVRDS